MQVSLSQLVAEARAQIDNVNPEQMSRVVDIREASERDETGAVHVPRGLLEFEADASLPSLHPDLDPSRLYYPLLCLGRPIRAGSRHPPALGLHRQGSHRWWNPEAERCSMFRRGHPRVNNGEEKGTLT